MLSKNTKVMVSPPDDNTDILDHVTGVLQGDTLVSYTFIICLDYALQTLLDQLKENGYTLTKARSRQYLAEIMRDVYNSDNLALLRNTHTKAKTLLHSVKKSKKRHWVKYESK